MANEQNVALEEIHTVKGETFTRDNLLDLSKAITDTIHTYAKEKSGNGHVDLFLLLAALGHVGFEASMKIFPQTKEEVEPYYNQMRSLADSILKKIDAVNVEEKLRGGADLTAVAHLTAVLAEFYAKRRDDLAKAVQAEAKE